jgi:hypothetical protein
MWRSGPGPAQKIRMSKTSNEAGADGARLFCPRRNTMETAKTIITEAMEDIVKQRK